MGRFIHASLIFSGFKVWVKYIMHYIILKTLQRASSPHSGHAQILLSELFCLPVLKLWKFPLCPLPSLFYNPVCLYSRSLCCSGPSEFIYFSPWSHPAFTHINNTRPSNVSSSHLLTTPTLFLTLYPILPTSTPSPRTEGQNLCQRAQLRSI